MVPSQVDQAGQAAGKVVAVVGGGIAGLAAAWELVGKAERVRVVVLEASAHVGGKIQAADVGGITVDTGPDAFLARRPEAPALCREIGIADELVAPGSSRAFVFSRGRLRPLPEGLALGIPTRLLPVVRSGILSPAGLARASVDLLGVAGRRVDADGDRAIGDLVTHRLGHEVVDRFVDPLIGGIHAGPVSAMSAAALYPPLLEASAKRGSLLRNLRAAVPAADPAAVPAPVFLAPRGGVHRVVDALVGELEARGVELRTSTPVTTVERTPGARDGSRRAWTLRAGRDELEADGVVLAVPAGPAAELLAPLDGAGGAALARIGYATVTVVTLVLPASSPTRLLDGTGFLVPAVEGWLTTACTWMSTKWPHLARPGEVVVRASVGRFGDERALAMTDDELTDAVVGELRPVLGLREGPSATLVTRWPGAFPQYAPGHLERVEAIDAGVRALGTIAVAGAAYRGVGIPACIAGGRSAARHVIGAGDPERDPASAAAGAHPSGARPPS